MSDNANVRNSQRILGSTDTYKMFRLLDITERKGEISDPWYTGNFEQTYDDIRKACEILIVQLDSESLLEGSTLL